MTASESTNGRFLRSIRFLVFVPGVPVLPREQYVLYKLQVVAVNSAVRYIKKTALTATIRSRTHFFSPLKLDERLSKTHLRLGNSEQVLDFSLIIWGGLDNYFVWGFF